MPMLHLDEPIAPGPAGIRGGRPRRRRAVRVQLGDHRACPRRSGTPMARSRRPWRTGGRRSELSSTDRMQIMTPPSHILGLLNIATALDAGAWIRLHPRFDIERCCATSSPTASRSRWPSHPSRSRLPPIPGLESYDLSSLRYVMWCATPVTTSVADEVTRRTGVTWVTAYGASELPVIACNALDGAHLDTVGRAVPGVEIRVVSLETGEPVFPGEVGEIQVRSAIGDGGIPSRRGHRRGVQRRLVPHWRRRLSRRRRAGCESPTVPRK